MSASAADRISSDLAEEHPVDGDVFDCPCGRSDAEVVLLEKVAQTVAVDEVDRWRAVAGGFLLGVRGERTRGDQQAFVSASRHCAAEVADRARAYAAPVALALEEHRAADKAEPVNAKPVDATVAAFAGDVDVSTISPIDADPPSSVTAFRVGHSSS